MSEPIVEPPQPQPFNPATVRRAGKGCSKPLLLGCAAVLVLFFVGLLVFAVKMPDIMSWLFRQWETQIVERLPDDVTPAERDRLHQAFGVAIRALRDPKAVDPARISQVQVEITRVLETGRNKLTHEELARLTAALESLGGVKPPREAPQVAPPPPATSDTVDENPGDDGDGGTEEPAKPPKTV